MTSPSGYYAQLPATAGDNTYFYAFDRNQWYRDLPVEGWTPSVKPDDDSRTLITTETFVYNDVGSTEFTLNDAMKMLCIYLLAGGGGGGGGSSASNNGGGGGSGGCFAQLVTPAQLLRVPNFVSVSVVVGAGGVGGAQDVDGSDGGDTSIVVYDGTDYFYFGLVNGAYGGDSGAIGGVGGLSVGGDVDFPVQSTPGGDGGLGGNGSAPIGSRSRSSGGSGGGGGYFGFIGGDGDGSGFRNLDSTLSGYGLGGQTGNDDGADGRSLEDDDIVGGQGGGGGTGSGNGGNGGSPAGGGGGGGSTGAAGGTGGDGASGRVVIVVVY